MAEFWPPKGRDVGGAGLLADDCDDELQAHGASAFAPSGARLDATDGPIIPSSASYRFQRVWLRTHCIKTKGTPTGMVLFFHGIKQHARGPEVLALANHIVEDVGCIWYGIDAQGHGRSGKLGDPKHPLPPATMISWETHISDTYYANQCSS